MKHLGDITQLSGLTLPPVDVVTSGSPCQDLSIAGKRAGLEGERSGLFTEQIRIIKEMREADARRGRTADAIRPRWMVWENVHGAFSSNKGEDFRVVLEEIARIADRNAVIPRPAGGIGYAEELSPTLKTTASGGNTVPCLLISYEVYRLCSLHSNSMLSDNPHSGCYRTDVACTLDHSGTNPACNQGGMLVVDGVLPFDTTQFTSPQNKSNPQIGDTCHSLAAGAHPPAIVVTDARGNGNGAVCPTLTGDHQAHISDYTAIAVDCRNHTTSEVSATLQAKENGGESLNYTNPVMTDQNAPDDLYVRRLTPTECERLQGYPDGWTDIGAWTDSKGKLHPESSDSARYKALGNSIALPFWRWMLARIMAYCDQPATLGSLFDGIGGFPLCWQQVGGVTVWASEIEEFPIAVTRVRFGEE